MKLFNWLLNSSKDPAQLSLTLKMGIPFVVFFFGLQGVGQDVIEPLLGSAAENLANVLVLAVQTVTGIGALVGLVRKIYLTLKK